MSFQVKTQELKGEVLTKVAEFVTRVKMADKQFADELVVKVDHNQLNLSTKVNIFFQKKMKILEFHFPVKIRYFLIALFFRN